MKFFAVALFALVAAVSAQNPDANAQVLRSDSTVNADSYQYAYETSNGIQAQEQGQLKTVGDVQAIQAQGNFKYNAPDGTPVEVTYVADENGFQPQGAHLPVAPEGPAIPEHVVRLVKYLSEHVPQQTQH